MNVPPILYEDKYLFVFDKPVGLMVHPDGRTKKTTLSDILAKEYPELKKVGEPYIVESRKLKVESKNIKKGGEIDADEDLAGSESILRPGIVHRLDQETSGCLIVAKTQKSFLFLKEQFKSHHIRKEYHAFVWGWPSRDFGEINSPIGRSKTDFRRWSSGRGTRGELREAITHYRMLHKFNDDSDESSRQKEGHAFCYVALFPKTGRTHQLRVHMKYLNHPIVGDSLYGGSRKDALGFKRLALHARKISFKTPDGKVHEVEAPFPADFKRTLQKHTSRAKV